MIVIRSRARTKNPGLLFLSSVFFKQNNIMVKNIDSAWVETWLHHLLAMELWGKLLNRWASVSLSIIGR